MIPWNSIESWGYQLCCHNRIVFYLTLNSGAMLILKHCLRHFNDLRSKRWMNLKLSQYLIKHDFGSYQAGFLDDHLRRIRDF